MIDDSSTGQEAGEAGDATVQGVLGQAFPSIERGINDFLALRGGLTAAMASLRASIEALRRHIYIEQEFVFPPLQRAGIDGPVFAMSFDHEDLWRTLDQMEEHLGDGSSQEDQERTCRILRAQLDRHTSREDPIVFKNIADVLTPEDEATLRDAVEHSVLPAGWVCPDASTE